MKDLLLKVLRNCEGKLGAGLWGIHCTRTGQVAALPHKGLHAIGLQRAKDL